MIGVFARIALDAAWDYAKRAVLVFAPVLLALCVQRGCKLERQEKAHAKVVMEYEEKVKALSNSIQKQNAAIDLLEMQSAARASQQEEANRDAARAAKGAQVVQARTVSTPLPQDSATRREVMDVTLYRMATEFSR